MGKSILLPVKQDFYGTFINLASAKWSFLITRSGDGSAEQKLQGREMYLTRACHFAQVKLNKLKRGISIKEKNYPQPSRQWNVEMHKWPQLFISPIVCLLMAKEIDSFLNISIWSCTSAFTESQGSMEVYGNKTQLSHQRPCPARSCLQEKLRLRLYCDS